MRCVKVVYTMFYSSEMFYSAEMFYSVDVYGLDAI